MSRTDLDPSRPLWHSILSNTVETVFGKIFDKHKIRVKIAEDKESLILFPSSSQAIISLKPGGIDSKKSVELTMNGGTGLDMEVIQTILGPSPAGRKLYNGIRPWCTTALVKKWQTGLFWEKRLNGIARVLRTTVDDIARTEGSKKSPEFEVPDNVKIIDAVAGAYAVVDFDIPENSYGYKHSLCLHVNIIDSLFTQLSYVEMRHPHISDNGRFCLDHTFRSAMQDRLAHGDLYSFLALLQESLMHLNFGDSYGSYPDLTRCANCDKYFRESMVITCKGCGRDFCTECMDEDGKLCKNCIQKIECGGCGNFDWEESIGECHACGKAVCGHCSSTKPAIIRSDSGPKETMAKFCNRCFPKCPECGNHLERGRTSICSVCENLICSNCITTQDDNIKCKSCLDTCDICGEALPTNHKHTCTECGSVVCCEHSSTRTGSEVVCVTCIELSKLEGKGEEETSEETPAVEALTTEETPEEAPVAEIPVIEEAPETEEPEAPVSGRMTMTYSVNF